LQRRVRSDVDHRARWDTQEPLLRGQGLGALAARADRADSVGVTVVEGAIRRVDATTPW
jgi:hypothetical protein